MLLNTILIIVLIIWAALAGAALLVNFFTSKQSSFWAAIFHRCRPLDVIMLSPGLLWVLPLAGASVAIRAASRLRK